MSPRSATMAVEAGSKRVLPWFATAPHYLKVLASDALAHEAASQLVENLAYVLQRKPHAVLIASAGRSPRQTYSILRKRFRGALDWQRVICVQMDEYAGVSTLDTRGIASELRRELIDPLKISRFDSFYGVDGAAICSLTEYEMRIRHLGGIDVALHGLGRNGHVAFNEPSAIPRYRTRAVMLAESTRRANAVLFRKGVTLGAGILGEARMSIVLLIGAAKRDAAEAFLFGAFGPQNPASYLRRCLQVSILMDPAATPELVLALTAAATRSTSNCR